MAAQHDGRRPGDLCPCLCQFHGYSHEWSRSQADPQPNAKPKAHELFCDPFVTRSFYKDCILRLTGLFSGLRLAVAVKLGYAPRQPGAWSIGPSATVAITNYANTGDAVKDALIRLRSL